MQFLTDTRIDFMKYRLPLAVVSLMLVVGSLATVLFVKKLNIGIDFAGGTQVTLRFKEQPDVDQLRSVLGDAGFPAAVIQRFGTPGSNEVLIRTPTVEGEAQGLDTESDETSGEEGLKKGPATILLEALDARFNSGEAVGTDLNRESAEALATQLAALDPDGIGVVAGDVPDAYREMATQILSLRRDNSIISSWDELRSLPGVSGAAVDALEREGHLGNFAILAVENVGPQIGSELKSQGIWAVVLSLVGMLIYIAIRFEIRFGVGAVAAIAHDVSITLGLYALAGFEFNVTTIAAFLTLVGYSVNDTVVVFDRVRENMRRARRESLEAILNTSINQTLSRTVMTSGTTILVVGTIFFFGGDVLRGFAFLLLIGIVVGTYSSVFIASPVVLLWEKYFGRAARSQRARVK